MKVSIKLSLAPDSASDLAIRLRLSYDGQRIDLHSGRVCPPECWQGDRMAPGTTNRYGESAREVNAALAEQEKIVMRILARHELLGEEFTLRSVRDEFYEAIGKRKKKSASGGYSLRDAFQDYMRDKKLLSASSVRLYQCVLASIDPAILSKGCDDLTPSDLDGIVEKYVQDGMENSSIRSYLQKVVSALNHARKNGKTSTDVMNRFELGLKTSVKKDLYYLLWEEVERLIALDLTDSKRHLSTVRDLFVLCCSTGLRISDASKLRAEDVDMSPDNPHINVVTKKTSKAISIELNRYSRAILEDYLSKVPSGRLFPKMYLCDINSFLRRLAMMAGLDRPICVLSFVGTRATQETHPIHEVITSHWGRHTFVVHALSLGISPQTIMSWTGHSSYDAIKPYIAIVSSLKKSSMKKFDER